MLGKEIEMQGKPTEYGFEWGPLKIERGFCDDAKGWATLILSTKKYPHGIQIYVTKTGKVRVHSAKGEWLPNSPLNRLAEGQSEFK